MKVVQYYLTDIKLWQEKWNLDVVCHTLQSCGFTIPHLIGINLELVRFSMSYLVMMSVDLIYHKNFRLKIIVALCFLLIGY